MALAKAQELPRAERTRQVVGLAVGQPEWRILIVEDGEDNRRLLRQLLEPLGFAVRKAENGEEGVALWQDWRPHLIWMDMRMPVLDGYAAARQIKDQDDSEATRIVALTASAFEEDRDKVPTPPSYPPLIWRPCPSIGAKRPTSRLGIHTKRNPPLDPTG